MSPLSFFGVLESLGWIWRDGILYAPRGTLWLRGPYAGEVTGWYLSDDFHRSMLEQVARARAHLADPALRRLGEDCLADLEPLVGVLGGMR